MAEASSVLPVQIVSNAYGKSRVRLVRVFKKADRHEMIDMTFEIQLQGDFDEAYLSSSNRTVLPTDTMKNTVYAIAKTYVDDQPELLGMRLARHFVSTVAPVKAANISVVQHSWHRLIVKGEPHAHAFSREGSGSKRTAQIRLCKQSGWTVHGGIEDLLLLKTTMSGFEDYIRDPYTTLKETKDRILGTNMKAVWKYQNPEAIEYASVFPAIRDALIEAFAGPAHSGVYSPSVQFTLYQMASRVLQRVPQVAEVSLRMPNLHCNLVSLAPFGMDNPNEVFVPIDEPHGTIQATLTRTKGTALASRL
uniref:Uricase n=1 Tax=Cyanoptyche gloeocystis TaxID=77922 RepID=A0A7S2NPF3_9EUKA